ncbi:MAG: S66 peptidase family protein [Bacteroidota bacterium]
MITPPALQPGDKVGIVAPARKISKQNLDTAIKLIHSWGLQVVLGQHVFSETHSYLSAQDDRRRIDFQHMLDDAQTKAIICARGGYGSTRFIDRVDLGPLLTNPKWIVGFSDITAVHLKLFCAGFQSIHATMPVLFDRPDAQLSVESLRKVLFGEAPVIEASTNPANRLGTASGIAIGGNLSLINDSLGTNSEPDTTGKILIVEEIDEYLYRLDRMFTQLKRAGKLEKLAGLVVGHMTDIKDTELSFGEDVESIIANAVRDYSFPVAFNFPIGHDQPNMAWVHGSEMTLTVETAGSVLKMD